MVGIARPSLGKDAFGMYSLKKTVCAGPKPLRKRDCGFVG
jgi:hypothetical protein